jgi:nitric oxide synthase-interacting protein
VPAPSSLQVCGHVVCKTCVDKIVKPGKQCVACDATVKEKDVVELQRDGTGYAAAGKAEAVKVRRADEL